MLILNEVLVPSISISILNFDDDQNDQYEALGYFGCLVRFKTAQKVLTKASSQLKAMNV